MYLFNSSLSLLSSYLHHFFKKRKKKKFLIAVPIRDKFYLSVLSWPLSHSKSVCPISGRAVSHQENSLLLKLTTFNCFRAPARIPECQHMFSSLTAHFQLVFNYFQLFLAVFIYIYFIRFHLFSIDFIHF